MDRQKAIAEITNILSHFPLYRSYYEPFRYEVYAYDKAAEILVDLGYGNVKQAIKEVLQKVVNICKNEEDYQDGTVNTQLEKKDQRDDSIDALIYATKPYYPLHLGIAVGCAYVRSKVKELAKEYDIEVDE
ncbi:MAG: hypothetical protein NC350_03955 [Corallococcus sp.]|nr:hypothetical protein [Corallococcus sp.]